MGKRSDKSTYDQHLPQSLLCERFDDKAKAEAIESARQGQTLNAVALVVGVSRPTIDRHRKNDATFKAAMDEAMLANAFDRLDLLREDIEAKLSDNPDRNNAVSATARIANLKFWLEKRFPAVFAPRQQIDVTQRLELGDLLASARLRERAILSHFGTNSVTTLVEQVGTENTGSVYVPAPAPELKP